MYIQMAPGQDLQHFLGGDTSQAVGTDGIINTPSNANAGDVWPGWYINVTGTNHAGCTGGPANTSSCDVELEWDIAHTDVYPPVGYDVWGYGANFGNSLPTDSSQYGQLHPTPSPPAAFADNDAAMTQFGGAHSPLTAGGTVFAVSMPVSEIAALAYQADGVTAANWTSWQIVPRVDSETDWNYTNGGVNYTSAALNVVAPYLPGDADRNGTVNGADLNTVLSNFNKTVPAGADGWALGDFEGNGTINGADLNIVLSNFNQVQSVGAAVPEPSTLLLAAAGLAGLLASAWRKRRT